jgi:hypothetical protein
MGMRKFILQRRQISKRGKIGPIKRKFFIFFLLSIFSFAIIQFRNQINYSLVQKIGGGVFSPVAPAPSYAYAFNYNDSHLNGGSLPSHFQG